MNAPERTRAAAASLIEELAATSLARHELTQRPDGSWRCGVPGTVHYAFNLFTAPGVCLVWGDLGDFTLRHSDRNGLAWWLGAGSRDYFLGKITACSDGDKCEFLLGEAHRHLAYLEAENVANQRQDPEEADDELYAKNRGRYAAVRARMQEVVHEPEREQARAWWEIWRELGDDDPPTCDGWKFGPLWLWECARAFRRLHAAREALLAAPAAAESA